MIVTFVPATLRTATGEVNEEAKKHFQAQLEAIHTAFKDLVKKYRPQVDIEKVYTSKIVEAAAKDMK